MTVEEIQFGGVRGLLTLPAKHSGAGIVISHGAGGNARTPFQEKLAAALASHGLEALRIDLPFRQRHAGPPRPAEAAADRDGIREAIAWMRVRGDRTFAGGHSYGGRQTSMMAAEHPKAADVLLFTSYPLHPPGKPESLRTEHWPRIATPSFFVHGTKDAFGSIAEMQKALEGFTARHELFTAESQGHSLGKLDFLERFIEFAG